MSDMNMEQEVPNLELKQFSKLPGGWQRVIIAVVFVVILIGVVLLRQMMQTAEDAHQEEASV